MGLVAWRTAVASAAMGFGAILLAPAAGALEIVVTEKPRVAFEWRRDRCERDDLPDAPARAIRRPDGTIAVFASHHVTRVLTGRTFSDLKHSCDVAFRSRQDGDPANYNDRTWVASLWTENGVDVLALGHQEFQAHRHLGRCALSEYGQCWFNTINQMASNDGGRTFSLLEPVRPVAALPIRSEERQGRPRGFFEPSNLVRKGDHIYTLINTTGLDDQRPGLCLFRAPVASSRTWEVLTGSGWLPADQDPYRGITRPACEVRQGIYGPAHSLLFHEPSNQFIAIMTMPGGRERGNFAFSTSADLLEWSPPKIFYRTTSIFSGRCATSVYSYPSLLDENSSDPALSHIGRSATLFVIRQNRGGKPCNGTLDRDLLMLPVEIL